MTSTQIYLQPRLEDLIAKMADLHERRRAAAAQPLAVPAGYDETELAELVWSITVINAWNRVAVTTHAWPLS